jgi:hypothetical protein
MALLEELEPRTQPEGQAFDLIQQGEVRWPPLSTDDKAALKIVVQDMQRAESWLWVKGLPLEWDRCDRLYHFKVPTQYWEGTPIPRSHLGMPLVFEHIESILPQVMVGLFSDEPPFRSNPRPGTSMEAARANDALLGWELQETGFREEIRLGAKSALLYGVGIWKYGWKSFKRTRKVYRRKQAPQFEPTGLGGVMLPGSDEMNTVEVTEDINRPTFEAVSLRHILVDPSTRTSDIRKAKYVIHRLYLTAQDLDELRDYQGYNIPAREKLIALFFPPVEQAQTNSLEGSSLDLNQEFKAEARPTPTTIDPLSQPLEVLEYWTPTRVYTIVQRKLVIRNEANEFGAIPFLSAAYTDVLDSFYGIGIAKLNGGEQRMQQGVINSFLDDLSLSLNGMFVRMRGANVPTQQLRMRPGGIIDTDTEKGIAPMQRNPIPVEVFSVLAASDARAQRRTAANELVVQGSLPSQQSSITRTATGANLLAGGSGARLQYLVENIADQVFVPALEAFHSMNSRHLLPSQISAILSEELGQKYKGDVVDLVNARVKFTIVAASKLSARRSLGMSLPLLFQFILTEPVMSALQQEGKKINIAEMVNMLFDVTGWPNRQDVIVPMSQEDMQRAMLNNPMVQQIIAQRSAQRQQQADKLQTIEEENVARAGRDIIQSLLRQQESDALGMNEQE